jgi:hypothetical protein
VARAWHTELKDPGTACRFTAAARSSPCRGQTSVTSRRPSSGGTLNFAVHTVPIATEVERQNIQPRRHQAWREFLPHLAVTVALVKQHHSRTRLARREVRRLERSSSGVVRSTTRGAGACPAAPCTTPTASSANGKNRLFMSVFLAEYRKSSPRKLPEPVSRKALGTWIRGGARNARGVNRPRPILNFPQIERLTN